MINTLLVPLDHSAFAEEALVPAAAIARTLSARLDLAFVHEVPKLANLRRPNWHSERLEEGGRYLERIAARLARDGVQHVTYSVIEGDVADAIIERAHAVDASLIVMTSHGATGFSRARLGSVADDLVQKSERPVLLLRISEKGSTASSAQPPFQRILVPLDGSEASESVLPAAMDLATCTNATVVLLHVVEPVPMFVANFASSLRDFGTGPNAFIPSIIQDIEATEQACASARAELAEIATRFAKETISGIESHVVVATRPSSAIVDYATATNVDMIAMSTHGRGLSRWLLGSVSDAVLRTGTLPLLLSRPVQAKVSEIPRTRRSS